MKPFWTIGDDAGAVVVENIYDYLQARVIAQKLVNEFGREFIVKEYGLRCVSVFSPRTGR